MKNLFKNPQSPFVVFLPNFKYGGAEKLLIQIANTESRNGRKVKVVAADATGELLRDISDKIEIVDLKKKSVSRCLIPLIKFFRHRDAMNSDVLTTMYHCNILLCIIKIVVPSLNIIIRESTSIDFYKKEFSSIRLFFFKILAGFFYPMADKLIFPSDTLRRKFEAYIKIPDQLGIIFSNPLDTETIDHMAQEEISSDIWTPRSKNVLINVGRVDKNKNQVLIIEALAKIKELEFEFILVGDGPELEKLKELVIIHGLETKVTFAGFQPNPFKFMRMSHIFIFSSLAEGYPNVLLQAKHLNLEIIATDCPTGPREILESEPSAILLDLESKDLTQRMSEAIRKKLRNCF